MSQSNEIEEQADDPIMKEWPSTGEVTESDIAWLPIGDQMKWVPNPVKQALEEVVRPLYQRLVVEAADPMDRAMAASLVHLLWLQILEQEDERRDYVRVYALLGIPGGRWDRIERYMKVMDMQLKVGRYFLHIEDVRQRWRREDRAEAARLGELPPEPGEPHAIAEWTGPPALQSAPPRGPGNPGFPPDGLHDAASSGDDIPDSASPGGEDEPPRGVLKDDDVEMPIIPDRREKTRKDLEKLARVRAKILANPDLFARQGSVVTRRRRRKSGRSKYHFELRYRAGGRPRRIYLGPSTWLAAEVRRLLEEARRAKREEQLLRKATREAKAAVRRDRQDGWVQAGPAGAGAESPAEEERSRRDEEIAEMLKRLPPETARAVRDGLQEMADRLREKLPKRPDDSEEPAEG